MREIGADVVLLVSGILTLAIIAVLVGRNSQTGSVITSSGNALSSVITAAVAPVSGSSSNLFGAAAGSAIGAMVGG